jgi:hypothetical protein
VSSRRVVSIPERFTNNNPVNLVFSAGATSASRSGEATTSVGVLPTIVTPERAEPLWTAIVPLVVGIFRTINCNYG